MLRAWLLYVTAGRICARRRVLCDQLDDRLQLIGRYTFLDSDGPNGILLGIYENRIVTARGDEYHEGYLGANYFFYGHKLKLQTGLQYAHMDDRANDGGAYSGLSWTTGIRVSWP